MDSSHRLRDLLQLQLASDTYAVLHLPFLLESLSKEDFQPSALETVTDIAGEYFRKLAGNFNCFREQPKTDAETPRFSYEEQVLHSLHENGVDLEGLETYVKDDVERLTAKLGVVHERMKAHLADLLVSTPENLEFRPLLLVWLGLDGCWCYG